MLIYIDGPEKAGKTTLAERTRKGFEMSRSKMVKWAGRDKLDGLGYLRAFVDGIDSNNIHIWDRGWVSEVVYGTLLRQDRRFATDHFACEWFYQRPLLGRGGRFILLPSDVEKMEMRRDDTDIDVDPQLEFNHYADYAKRWGYSVISNGYKEDSLEENARTLRGSIFQDIVHVPSTVYIGPRRPSLTFIGQTHQEFSFNQRPFYNNTALEYFRPFGKLAIDSFGYAFVESFEPLRKYPRLIKNVVTVGQKAAYMLPQFPNVPYVMGEPSRLNVDRFMQALADIKVVPYVL